MILTLNSFFLYNEIFRSTIMKYNNVGVLKLDSSWQPVAIISAQKAAKYYQTDKILSEVGTTFFTMNGGINKERVASRIDIKPIIVVKGQVFGKKFSHTPRLKNDLLFKRDKHTCAYCCGVFPADKLSRDHIIPRHQNGRDIWTNVVTACKPCNTRKANKTPEQARMNLKIKPYIPSYLDVFLLKTNLLPEQKDFLLQMSK